VGGVELGGKAVHVIRKQVAVTVESDLDAGVAELRLDRLGVGALGDEQGGARMAEIVDAETLR